MLDLSDNRLLSVLSLWITLALIIILIRKINKRVHSNWRTLVPDFTFSVDQWYTLLKEEFKAEDLDISFDHVYLSQGGFFSQRREYLRIRWKSFHFDMCAFPMSSHFVISWWLLYRNNILNIIIAKIPLFGEFLASRIFKITYYRIDSASAFMTIADSCVKRALTKMTDNTSVRVDIDSKPIMNNVFAR